MIKSKGSYKRYYNILPKAKRKEFAPLFKQFKPLTIFEEADNALKNIKLIKKLNKFVHNPDTLELRHIHKLLEENIWMIDYRFKVYSSNKSLKRILIENVQKKFKTKERKRPDIICKNNFANYVVIELKRPKHKITLKDLSQLFEYFTIIKEHCPNCNLVDGYLIGSKFSEVVRTASTKISGVFLLSFTEILSDLKLRYKESIEIFKVKELL